MRYILLAFLVIMLFGCHSNPELAKPVIEQPTPLQRSLSSQIVVDLFYREINAVGKQIRASWLPTRNPYAFYTKEDSKPMTIAEGECTIDAKNLSIETSDRYNFCIRLAPKNGQIKIRVGEYTLVIVGHGYDSVIVGDHYYIKVDSIQSNGCITDSIGQRCKVFNNDSIPQKGRWVVQKDHGDSGSEMEYFIDGYMYYQQYTYHGKLVDHTFYKNVINHFKISTELKTSTP